MRIYLYSALSIRIFLSGIFLGASRLSGGAAGAAVLVYQFAGAGADRHLSAKRQQVHRAVRAKQQSLIVDFLSQKRDSAKGFGLAIADCFKK